MRDPGGDEADAGSGFVSIERWCWNVAAVRRLSSSCNASSSLLYGDDAVWTYSEWSRGCTNETACDNDSADYKDNPTVHYDSNDAKNHNDRKNDKNNNDRKNNDDRKNYNNSKTYND